MLSYYLNLPKEDGNIGFDTNMKLSYAIMKTATSSFEPFENYLQNAINAMEKKEIIAKWKKVETGNIAELRIKGKLYEIPKNMQVLLLVENLDIKVGDMLRGSFTDHKILLVNEMNIALKPPMEEYEDLFFNKKKVEFNIKETEKPKGYIVQEDTERYVIYSEYSDKPYGAKEIKQIADFVNFENIVFENGKKLEAERNENSILSLTLKNESDFGKKVICNGIKFSLERNNKKECLIQLSEIDDNQNDEIGGLSPLRYFFDDDVFLVDGENEKIEYKVDFGKEQENKIALKGKNEKGYWISCYPQSETIRVKVNTYPLKKQKESIATLKNMPIEEHRQLIKLFEDREEARWKRPNNTPVEKWFVIEDENRSGVEEQRKFVEQALNTPDFAILEGPPGSGKTTVILEIVCQLAKQGKRVLLCGSTHVAVDNILERLKEKRGESSLLEEFQILPIRIGDQNRINNDIKEFQINNLMENNGISEDAVELLLDSANLVCGTTIGILQHPKFKKRNRWIENKKMNNSWIEPIIPEFDYLIIDESSKTTFQEFLVPALYAKKWILVGDCLQLSPFTERDEIVSNIKELQVCGKPVDKHLQSAVFYLHKLKDLLKGNNKFVLPVSEEEIGEIKKEWEKGRIARHLLCFIKKEKQESTNTLVLAVYDIIFVDKNILEIILPKLPETHTVLRYSKWTTTRHAFAHNVFSERNNFTYKEKDKDYTDSFEITKKINEYFNGKNWAEEIAWRIDREHQLRLVEKNKTKEKYAKVVDELIPLSLNKEEVENAINMTASMAFPSILESLANGIKGRKMKFESTISDGFKEQNLEVRRTILTFQHRMHPEISKFPRERFYKKDNALKDLQSPQGIGDMRRWNYKKYSVRNFWLNVEGKTEYNNRNYEEAKHLTKHLSEFVDWAKNNEQPENKDWDVACLTFYRGQEKIIREELRKFTKKENGVSSFKIEDGKFKINIKLHTVDKFQGHEADVVFLSMVQTKRDGFMDNPNRLNVAITRAKFQLVVIGDYKYFSESSPCDDLKELAKSMEISK
jgi:superfamily I DNA and/or RNA helicase